MAVKKYDQTYPDVHNTLDLHDPRIAFYMLDSFRRKQLDLELAIAVAHQESDKLRKQALELQALLQTDPFSMRLSALKEEYAKAMEMQAKLETQSIIDAQLKQALDKFKLEIEELNNKRSKLDILMGSLLERIKATASKIQMLQGKRSDLLRYVQQQIATIHYDDAVELSRLLDSQLLVTESGQAVHISAEEVSRISAYLLYSSYYESR